MLPTPRTKMRRSRSSAPDGGGGDDDDGDVADEVEGSRLAGVHA